MIRGGKAINSLLSKKEQNMLCSASKSFTVRQIQNVKIIDRNQAPNLIEENHSSSIVLNRSTLG